VGGQSHAPAALSPRKSAGTHCTGGWMVPRAGAENLASAWTRSLNRSARSESLYRLRCLGLTGNWNCSNNSHNFTVSLDSSLCYRLLFHYNVHSLAPVLRFYSLNKAYWYNWWYVGGPKHFYKLRMEPHTPKLFQNSWFYSKWVAKKFLESTSNMTCLSSTLFVWGCVPRNFRNFSIYLPDYTVSCPLRPQY